MERSRCVAAKHTIQDKRIRALPTRSTLNAEYSRDNILAELIHIRPEGQGRKLSGHADNARADMEKNAGLVVTINRGPWDTHPPRLLLHPQTAFGVDPPNTVCSDRSLQQPRKGSKQLGGESATSRRRLERTSFTTEWRD
jgi:hypothetical protein